MRGGIFRKKPHPDDFWLNAELIIKAWQMSMILIGDRVRASDVVLKAINRTVTHHPKLRYYELSSRTHRNKVIFDKAMVLQYFIYQLAEDHEVEQEREYLAGKRFLHHQTMIIRYIKHLLLLSKSRSFSVTVGLCRLLYDYKHCHTSSIYEVLTQYCGPDKSDREFRDCKLDLMKGLVDRFHRFLTPCQGPRGEKRFLPYENQSRIAGCVKQCLNLFTPWKSSCILPTALAGAYPSIPPLSFLGPNPDDEHPIEKARIHTLIHPTCFSQLAKALGCSFPDERLAMPHLSISTDQNEPPIDLNNPPVPTSEELNDLRDAIERQRHKRQRSSQNELAIVVDGIQRDCIALEKTDSAKVELKEGDDLIQVFSKERGGNILLSTLSLRFNEIMGVRGPWESCVRLEGGQEIGIGMSVYNTNDAGRVINATAEVTYRETRLIRASFLRLRRLKYKMSQSSAFGVKKLCQDLVWMRTLINRPDPDKKTGQLAVSQNTFYIVGGLLSVVLALFVLGAIRLAQKETFTRSVQAENERLRQSNKSYALSDEEMKGRILNLEAVLKEQARQASNEGASEMAELEEKYRRAQRKVMELALEIVEFQSIKDELKGQHKLADDLVKDWQRAQQKAEQLELDKKELQNKYDELKEQLASGKGNDHWHHKGNDPPSGKPGQ